MALTLYHAEPVANSLKALIPLHEKGLPFTSRYIDLAKYEQHEPWFVAINPEGQVPVLDHDGLIITHTTVMNEYLEDAFPDTPALRPKNPGGAARMRYWNKFIDEHVMNYVSIHGWRRRVAYIAQNTDAETFEEMVARIPLVEQQRKWRKAREGFDQAELDEATRKVDVALAKVEEQLQKTPWLAGEEFTLADINFYCHCGMMAERLFPELASREKLPKLFDWIDRVTQRPAVQKALASEDRMDTKAVTYVANTKA